MEAWREELYHHGVKGQKWGVRRYQDLDGSLTALGKRHIKLNPSYKGSVVSVDNGPSKSSGGGGNLEAKDFSKLDEELAGILGRNPNYVLESGDQWLAELGEMGYDVDTMSEEEISSLFEHAKEWLSANRQSEPQEEQPTEEESKAKKSGGKSKGSSGKGSSKGSSKSSAAEQKTAKAVESGSERKDIDAARDRASDSFWRQYGISSEAFKQMSADEQKRYLQAARKKKDKYMRDLGFSHSDYTGWSIECGVLVHHGVKGQKWGVRRYQDLDGSLTALGKKHNAQLQSQPSSGGGGGGGPIDEEQEKLLEELKDEFEKLEKELGSMSEDEKRKYLADIAADKLSKYDFSYGITQGGGTRSEDYKPISKETVSKALYESGAGADDLLDYVKTAITKSHGHRGQYVPDQNNDPERRDTAKDARDRDRLKKTTPHGKSSSAGNSEEDARRYGEVGTRHRGETLKDTTEMIVAAGHRKRAALTPQGRHEPDNAPASDSMDNRRYAATHTPQGRSTPSENARADSRYRNNTGRSLAEETGKIMDRAGKQRQSLQSRQASIEKEATKAADAEVRRRRGTSPNVSQFIQRNVRSDMLDKPDNVSKEYWRTYKSNGGTYESYIEQEKKRRRENDRYKYVGHSEFTIGGNYLMHHGVKGQKWGVRRYQNADGTLTAAGRRRVKKDNKTLKRKSSDIITGMSSLRYFQNKYFEDAAAINNAKNEREKRIAIANKEANDNWFKWTYEQLVKDLTTYKEAEDSITALGGKRIVTLLDQTNYKTVLADSPYNKKKQN